MSTSDKFKLYRKEKMHTWLNMSFWMGRNSF